MYEETSNVMSATTRTMSSTIWTFMKKIGISLDLNLVEIEKAEMNLRKHRRHE